MTTYAQKTTPTFALRPIAAALAMLSASLPAYAQETAPAKTENTQLETVVVTANKRAQNLQDVPASITVLNEAALQRANVRDFDDLPALSPALSVTYSTHPGNYSINMRGIGTFSLGIGVEADVSVIIDDIPIGIQAGAFKDLTDVFRVEVLKGPQSTLFGKSSIAGAVNITTKPIGGPLKLTTSTQATNDSEWRIGAAVAGSISDNFRVRLATSKTSFDGTLNNLTTGRMVNGSKGETVVGKFEWNPTDNLTLTLSPSYNSSEKFCCTSALTFMTPGGLYKNIAALPASTVLAGITPGPGNINIRSDSPIGGVSHTSTTGFKANYQFPQESGLAGYALASISAYSTYHMDDYNDGDGTDADVLAYIKENGKLSGFHGGLFQNGFFNTISRSQEIRLTSPDSGNFRFVTGLWYGDNQLERELNRQPATSYATLVNAKARNTSYSVFGQSSWSFLPNTSLITGLRLNREDTSYHFQRFTPSPAPRVLTEDLTGKNTNNDVTGRLGLEHRVNKDIMVYGMFSTGHKGVAYDLTSSFTADTAKYQPVPAETARSFELGAKTNLLNNRAMLNVALFQTKFKGFQQSAGFTDPDGLYRTVLHSIGGLQTRGVEVDGTFKVSPTLLLNGGFGYTEATISDFENGPCYAVEGPGGKSQPGPGCAANPKYNNTMVQNLAGKTLPNAPKVKLNLGAQYDILLPERSFNAFVTGSYNYTSAIQYSLNQDPLTIQDAYSIVNAAVGIRSKKDSYKLTFFVNNLFNQSYAIGLNNAVAAGNWNSAAPNPVIPVHLQQWTPARDYKRYMGVRLDMTF